MKSFLTMITETKPNTILQCKGNWDSDDKAKILGIVKLKAQGQND